MKSKEQRTGLGDCLKIITLDEDGVGTTLTAADFNSGSHLDHTGVLFTNEILD